MGPMQDRDPSDRSARDRLAARLVALREAGARAAQLAGDPIDAGILDLQTDQDARDAEYLRYLAGMQDPRD
jgi:hypothetical protein